MKDKIIAEITKELELILGILTYLTVGAGVVCTILSIMHAMNQ